MLVSFGNLSSDFYYVLFPFPVFVCVYLKIELNYTLITSYLVSRESNTHVRNWGLKFVTFSGFDLKLESVVARPGWERHAIALAHAHT